MGTLATACTGDSANSGSSTDLASLLRRVQATKGSTVELEYGNVAAIGLLSGDEAGKKQFVRIRGAGYAEIAARYAQIKELTGIDPMSSVAAIRVGRPPHQAGLLIGDFDRDAIVSKLEKVGGKISERDGRTTWVHAEDGKIDVSNPFDKVTIGAMNVITLSEGSIGYGRFAEDVALVTDANEPYLSDSRPHNELADCLGDVIAAYFITSDGGGYRAVGTRGTSATDVTEVFCATTKSEDAARTAADKIIAAMSDGVSEASRRKWSTLVSEPEVEVVGGDENVVRLTAKPRPADAPVPGVFWQAIHNRDFENLL